MPNRSRFLLLVLLLAAGVLLVRLVGFRCRPFRGDEATLCYSWFRPSLLILRDKAGKPYYYGVIENREGFRDLPAAREYVDLGGGVISLFAVNRLDARYGWVKTQDVSTRRDGRVDLVLEFHGKALTKALVVDWGLCSSQKQITARVGGTRSSREVCTDRAALRPISASQARMIVDDMRLSGEGAKMLRGPLWASKGQKLGKYLLM